MLLYLETIIDLLHRHVDGPLVVGAVCNVDVLATVAQSVRMWHPLNDACLLCQRNHSKPATGKNQAHKILHLLSTSVSLPCPRKLMQNTVVLASVQFVSNLRQSWQLRCRQQTA